MILNLEYQVGADYRTAVSPAQFDSIKIGIIIETTKSKCLFRKVLNKKTPRNVRGVKSVLIVDC